MKDDLASIKIMVLYKKELQEITGKSFEKVHVSKRLPFIMFLKFIFDSYPEIPENYPPGTIGLLLNGKVPKNFDILSQGDVVELSPSNLPI